MHDGVHHHNHRGGEVLSLHLDGLKVKSVLGRGAKGVVFLVENRNDEKQLALKAISRSSVHKNVDEYKRVWFEREVLSSFDHPLFPKLHGVLETDSIVGYAIDYCSGRDLDALRKIQTEKMFSIDIIRFYAAELVLALEYLHSLGIVYRDLKPDNVLIQDNGHLMLVDYDLSTKLAPPKPPATGSSPQMKTLIKPEKKNKFARFFNRGNSGVAPESPTDLAPESTEKSNSFVGTEEYIAPEIVRGDGHDFSVDLWCLGVMLYEMLYGTTPFLGSTRKDTFYNILTQSPDLTGAVTPLRDLIRKLLDKDPKKRITVPEIKGHDFFKAVDWDSVLDVRPPFIPPLTAVADMEGIDVESVVRGIFKAEEEEQDFNKYESHPQLIANDNFLSF